MKKNWTQINADTHRLKKYHENTKGLKREKIIKKFIRLIGYEDGKLGGREVKNINGTQIFTDKHRFFF